MRSRRLVGSGVQRTDRLSNRVSTTGSQPPARQQSASTFTAHESHLHLPALFLPPVMLNRARATPLHFSVESSAPLYLHFHARRSCCRLRAADERIEAVAAHVANATLHERRVQ